ncbi:hypothetical protein HELRODRAFT_84500 [Helobdella robusta]|uniref:Uncharacterized protein n=1 Tax=Helobdella robusta TaxID=6412 RepID=T1G5J2_HELRO|nr:hypothetical protein HELRODRAFT_84500 [Helobdella robusta]ESN98444.1 hypothetical protein HELRODRAFT_84500 [Helobdella robusta]
MKINNSVTGIKANEDAKRLYESIIKRNEYIINVVANGSTPLTVKLGLRLSQLVDVDEKNQIITTNVWLIQEWMNSNLKWDPADYSGLNKLHVPPQDLWIPDIVLYNNADGNYEVTLMTMVSIHSDGRVRWEPPVVYKSSCPIDVEFYPFDEQRCSFKFGSWTYDGFQEKRIKHQANKTTNVCLYVYSGSIDLRDFTESVEWDLLKVPGRRNQKYYTCCVEPFTDITFSIFIRRKTLFHTVNLIIPCVSITCLTVLVFYLPSDSGEKISLCISILLSLTVFFLLLAEIIPPTSLVIPLIGKFLLFTMILVTLSIVTTVIVLNVHFRSASAHTMPVWVRILFLRVLSRLLGLQDKKFCDAATRNESSEEELSGDQFHHQNVKIQKCPGSPMFRIEKISNIKEPTANVHTASYVNNDNDDVTATSDAAAATAAPQQTSDQTTRKNNLSGQRPMRQFMKSSEFVARHMVDEDEGANIREDWKLVARVLDRLFLFIFSCTCVVGTIGIIMKAPTIYDDRLPITTTSGRR